MLRGTPPQKKTHTGETQTHIMINQQNMIVFIWASLKGVPSNKHTPIFLQGKSWVRFGAVKRCAAIGMVEGLVHQPFPAWRVWLLFWSWYVPLFLGNPHAEPKSMEVQPEKGRAQWHAPGIFCQALYASDHFTERLWGWRITDELEVKTRSPHSGHSACGG